jgi:hypothetical protein
MSALQDRAVAILREYEQAQTEFRGNAVLLTSGIAGAIENIHLDPLHGLRITVVGHEGDWPVSTVRLAQEK